MLGNNLIKEVLYCSMECSIVGPPLSVHEFKVFRYISEFAWTNEVHSFNSLLYTVCVTMFVLQLSHMIILTQLLE